jgi:hypothetical protein
MAFNGVQPIKTSHMIYMYDYKHYKCIFLYTALSYGVNVFNFSFLLLRADETTTIAVIDTWLPRLRQCLKCCQISEARTYDLLQHKAASLIQKLARKRRAR